MKVKKTHQPNSAEHTTSVQALVCCLMALAILIATLIEGSTPSNFAVETRTSLDKSWTNRACPKTQIPHLPEIHTLTNVDESTTERTGFEPALRCRKRHFQCRAFNHSATSPTSSSSK